MKSVSDSTFLADAAANASLAEFLSRPVKIDTVQWTVGASLDSAFNIWYSYLNHGVIKNKIQNYEYLKGDLHIKILINASPFYYGAALASYRPLKNYTYAGSTANTIDNCIRSQRPHFWIYPQTNQGGEMVVPFFYNRNFLNITSASDVQNMGELEIDSFVNLTNANTVAGTDVDLQIYAWLTDVTLMCPTSTSALQGGWCSSPRVSDYESFREMQPIYQPVYKNVSDNWTDVEIRNSDTTIQLSKRMHMGSKKKVEKLKKYTMISYGDCKPQAKTMLKHSKTDEYDGVISAPASAIAESATALEKIPIIAPFARATSVVASAIAGVAAHFGFTKTPVIDNVQPFKNLPFHSFASTEIGEPIEKLTLDPKNELSIDPRIAGLEGLDEMNLKSLVTREAFFTSFTWAATDTAQTKLFNLLVSPMLPVYDAAGSAFVLPPVSHFSKLFKYWRGSLIFRFKIIASQYHRGRIQFFFDPSNSGTFDPSAQYNEIVDIADAVDVEITVPYLKDTPWTTVSGDVTSTYFNTGVLGANDDISTGLLSVMCNTQQTSPNAASDITVLCYVRAGDDFELGCPVPMDKTYQYFDAPEGKFDFSFARPQGTNVFTYENPKKIQLWQSSCSTNPNTFGVNMGEKVTSVRQILRRTTLTRTIHLTDSNTAQSQLIRATMSRYPLYNGYDGDGPDTTGVAVSYSYSQSIPFNWVVSCFVASRGSINWYFDTQCDIPYTMKTYRKSNEVLSKAGYYTATTITGSTSTPYLYYANVEEGWEGQSVLPQRTQTGHSVNVPFYSKYRFRNNLPADRALGFAGDSTDTDTVKFTINIKPLANPQIASGGNIDMYTCIGEDFSALFFLNTPKMYIYTTPVNT